MKSNKNNVSIKNTESVCNKLGTSKPTYRKIDSSILTYREILLLQPEKEDILNQWFEAIGNCWPRMNSIPVMDITEMVVYSGYTLCAPVTWKDPTSCTYYNMVRRSVENGIPYYSGKYPEYNGHMFIPVSKVDISILKESLAKYKSNKKKQEKLENLSKVLESLQKEIAELLNFKNSSVQQCDNYRG